MRSGNLFSLKRGAPVYDSRNYLVEKLTKIERLIEANKEAELSLGLIIADTQSMIDQIEKSISALSKEQNKNTVEFYSYFFEFVRFSNLMKVFKYRSNGVEMKKSIGEDPLLDNRDKKSESENSFDDFSLRSDEESEFDWKFRESEEESDSDLLRKRPRAEADTGEPAPMRWRGDQVEVKKPASRVRIQKKEVTSIAQKLLRPNIDKIIETFNLNLRDLQAIDFKQLVAKLNTIEFITKTRSQITVSDLFILLKEKVRQGKTQLNDFEKQYLIKLIGQCDFINFRTSYTGLKTKIPSFANTNLTFLQNLKNWKSPEDELLVIGYIAYGPKWSEISYNIFNCRVRDLQCRERFTNMIDPSLQGQIAPFTSLKTELLNIFHLRSKEVGWSMIAKENIPYRTDNEIFRFFATFKQNAPQEAQELESLCQKVNSGDLGSIFKLTRTHD